MKIKFLTGGGVKNSLSEFLIGQSGVKPIRFLYSTKSVELPLFLEGVLPI